MNLQINYDITALNYPFPKRPTAILNSSSKMALYLLKII